MTKPNDTGKKKPLKVKDLRATKNPKGGAEKVAKLGLGTSPTLLDK